MTTEQHLSAMAGASLFDLMIRLAAAKAEIDNLNELVNSLKAELAEAKK